MLLTQAGVELIEVPKLPVPTCQLASGQVLSYGQVYDRERLDEKKTIVDLLFAACMNPKAPTPNAINAIACPCLQYFAFADV